MMTMKEKYLLGAVVLGVGAILGYRYYQKKQTVALQPMPAGGGGLQGGPNVPASYQMNTFTAGTYKVETTNSGLALRVAPDPNAAFALPAPGIPKDSLVVANGVTQVSPAPASILYAQVQTSNGVAGWAAADYLVPA